MIFHKQKIPDLYTVELDKIGDDRGFFARFFCIDEYKDLGLDVNIVQMNNSFTKEKHTLRGMHYQVPPKAEARIVRCLKGSIYDMVLDLRPESPTYGEPFGIELSAENRKMTYIPAGCAHGFMTLENDTEILYLVTEFYSPDYERIIRWNDPSFNMKWPVEPEHLSEKDKFVEDFDKKHHLKDMENVEL